MIGLVGDLRNARASARLPAADWLETRVVVPPDLGDVFEGLRPAIERLARARPLHRELSPEALEAARAPGDLAVVVGSADIEATIRPPAVDPAVAALERDRLGASSRRRRVGWRPRGLDWPTMRSRRGHRHRSSSGARASEAELAEQVARLRDRLED